MILVITHSTDVTADYQCARLAKEQVPFVRIDSDTISSRVGIRATATTTAVSVEGKWYATADISCVWLRRPKAIEVQATDVGERLHSANEWGEALEGFLSQIPVHLWINHASRNARASHKIDQLTRAHVAGLHIPSTLVTQDAEEARVFAASHGGRIVVKPLFSGYVERASVDQDTQVYTSRVELEHLDRRELLQRCPTLFQAEVNKDYDVRVCYVDGRLRCIRMDRLDSSGQQILDIRRDNMAAVRYTALEAPDEVSRPLVDLISHYGLRFAAIDFAVTREGHWIFFEINPNGQWAWLDLAGVTDVAGDLMWAMCR